jgi:hypothetical protein
MCRDRKQPGCKRALEIITMKVLEDSQEGLLCGILRRFGMAQHAITQVVDWSLIRLNDVSKRFVVSVFGLEYPGLFLVHVTPNCISCFPYYLLRNNWVKVAKYSSQFLTEFGRLWER